MKENRECRNTFIVGLRRGRGWILKDLQNIIIFRDFNRLRKSERRSRSRGGGGSNEEKAKETVHNEMIATNIMKRTEHTICIVLLLFLFFSHSFFFFSFLLLFFSPLNVFLYPNEIYYRCIPQDSIHINPFVTCVIIAHIPSIDIKKWDAEHTRPQILDLSIPIRFRYW